MQVKPLFFDTYITAIENSVGSRSFQTMWAEVDGVTKDIAEQGRKSCALFVSAILVWFGLIKEGHVTVAGLIKDLLFSGWQKIDEPRVGCIIHWEKTLADGEWNEHTGFYMGDEIAISNSRRETVPIKHHWTYGEKDGMPVRKVLAMYWHPKLKRKYFDESST